MIIPTNCIVYYNFCHNNCIVAILRKSCSLRVISCVCIYTITVNDDILCHMVMVIYINISKYNMQPKRENSANKP